ncbi:MAG: NUDIX domain-containing protein [Candidatus Woesearchaeota archaeon]|jgi:8-oxo-dGTP diphosphatase
MTTQQIGVKAIIEQDNKILLIKRSAKYKHLEAAWDIPGGRTEFGEDPIDGLRREIKEETNLELDEIKQILDASTVFKNEEKHIVRITYLCTVKETNVQLSHEHTDMQWVPKEELKNIEFKDKILKKIINNFIP